MACPLDRLVCSWKNSSRRTTTSTNLQRTDTDHTSKPTLPTRSNPSLTSTSSISSSSVDRLGSPFLPKSTSPSGHHSRRGKRRERRELIVMIRTTRLGMASQRRLITDRNTRTGNDLESGIKERGGPFLRLGRRCSCSFSCLFVFGIPLSRVL